MYDVLFPLSYEKMSAYIYSQFDSEEMKDETDALKDIVAQKKAITLQSVSAREVIFLFREWIRKDKKEPSLKKIQGKIWKQSFESGDIRSPVYEDVAENFKKWKENKIGVYIYSSDSIEAQKAIFKYTEKGDITQYIDGYFDMGIGHRKETNSYKKITQALKTKAANILFFSGSTEELNTARKVGIQTRIVVRERFPIESKNGEEHIRVSTLCESL